MAISYNGLCKILIDKNMQIVRISRSTFAKISRVEIVHMSVL